MLRSCWYCQSRSFEYFTSSRFIASECKLQDCWLFKCTNNLVSFDSAWAGQKKLQSDIRQLQLVNSFKNALIVLQHESIFTLGRGSDPKKNFKFDPSSKDCLHKIQTVERGGEVTWHGPGQIVVYPILDLHCHKMDLHWYVRNIEEVVIRCLKDFNIEGSRMEGKSGVWVSGKKICSIGISASWWITMHGFALNVDPNLSDGFDLIVPCGLEGVKIGRMIDYAPNIKSQDVIDSLLSHFTDIFQLNLIDKEFSQFIS